MKKKVARLFEGTKPSNYKLLLELDPDKMIFKGKVTIRGRKTGRPSQRITFHQKGLKFISASAIRHDKKGDEPIVFDRINTHMAYDEVRLHSKSKLFPGEYSVMMEFRGIITEPMNGIYPCYFTHAKKDKKLLATQFESHHAREVFPCVDEPEAKATFDITLITPENKQAVVLGNTPVKNQARVESKGNPTLLKTVFETTPIMSSYLVAFAYGELGFKETKAKSGVTVRAYSTPDNVEYLEFAVSTASKVLDFYENYFDISYPLPKCDMVALPDFASAAMENWGLVTYREQALLVDDKNTSLTTKQQVAMVIAHELAHMWFGNLVTMRWWTDLWLNEGFASWIEYLAVDHLYPEWDIWTQYITEDQAHGMRLDALEFTHPVEVEVRHPDEIRTIFDAISYQKGSGVIHMLHNYLGAETFREGLRHYLKLYAYSNTDTVDLWAAIEEISKKPVKKFMHAWTSQSGFPIVRANVGKYSASLTQDRFYLNPEANKSDLKWPVPLLASETLKPDTLEHGHADIKFQQSSNPLILNANHQGFFRTIYDSTHLALLAKSIRGLGATDRIGLLGDAFEAAKAGYSPTVDVMELLEAYTHEQNAAVWDIIAGNIIELRRVMNDDFVRENLKPYISQLTAPELERLGWDEKPNDSHFDKLLRPTILGLASGADVPSVVEECTKRFQAVKASEDLHPDLRGIVYATVARRGSKAEFSKLLNLYDSTQNAEERITLAAAITNFEQDELIDKSLGFITTDRVRLQDVAYWIIYSFSNRFAKDKTWQWVKDNWAWMDKNLGTDLSFYRTPVYTARAFSDEIFLKEFKKFFEPLKNPKLERSINQGIEIIQWQSAWRTRDLNALQKYLKAK
ncbi:M1 family metallopeptidase [Candidatus Saccharibacteria bacterium]|nr:M1 family metallopeptidase [Candidatus Saccharibacteria bacterium]